MTDFVVDKGLDVLLAQINTAAPNRSKASDGSIGDAAHASRDSDHNPESPPPPGNPDHQVDARDFTHDPAHNADMGIVSEAIRTSRDRRVSYVIFNRRIFSSYTSTGGRPAWTWGAYSGEDPHTGHMHISVNDVHHDETQLWQIGITMTYTQEEIVNALANGSINKGYVTGTETQGQPGYNLQVKDNNLRQVRTELAAVTSQARTNGSNLSTLISAVTQVQATVTQLGQALTDLAAKVDALELGGLDEAVLEQRVRDAVRAELDATRLRAG